MTGAGNRTGAVTLRFNDACQYNQDGVILNIHRWFRGCLKNSKPIRAPLGEGIQVLKLSTLALESSRAHTEIELDERM